jgi:hypothetical protein
MKAALLAMLFVSTAAMAGPSCVVNTDGVTVDTSHILTAAPCRDGGMQKIIYVCLHTDKSDQTIKLTANDDMRVAEHITAMIANTMKACKP